MTEKVLERLRDELATYKKDATTLAKKQGNLDMYAEAFAFNVALGLVEDELKALENTAVVDTASLEASVALRNKRFFYTAMNTQTGKYQGMDILGFDDLADMAKEAVLLYGFQRLDLRVEGWVFSWQHWNEDEDGVVYD